MAGGTSHTPRTIGDLRRALAALAAELDGREEWRALRQLDERERGGDPLDSLDGVLLRGRLVRQLEATSRAWRAYAAIQEAILQLEGPDALPQLRIATVLNADAALIPGAAGAIAAEAGAADHSGHPAAAPQAASDAAAEMRRQRVKVRAASLPLAPGPPGQPTRQASEPAASVQASTGPGASADGVTNQAPDTAQIVGTSRPALPAPAERAAVRAAELPVAILPPASPSAGPVAPATPARGPSILDRIQSIQAITTSRASGSEATPASPSSDLWGARPARAPEPTVDVAPRAGPAESGSAGRAMEAVPVPVPVPVSVPVPVRESAPRPPHASGPGAHAAGPAPNAAQRLDRVEVEIDGFLDAETAIWARPMEKVGIERQKRLRAVDFDANGEELVPDEAEVTIVRLDRMQVPEPAPVPVPEPEPRPVPVAPTAGPTRNGPPGDGPAGPSRRQANGLDDDDDRIDGGDYAGYCLDVEEADVEIIVGPRPGRGSNS